MQRSYLAHTLLAAALATTLPTTAALTYELRTPGLTGRELTLPATGGSFTLQLYANITDSPLSEGLTLTTVNLFSRPIDGGIATGGGVTAFELDTLGRRNFGFNGGAQNGANPAPGDLVPSYTNDGILDWGTAENFGAALSTSAPTQPGSRAKFNRSISYVATDNTQTAGAFYTVGNQILVGTFTISFSAADVKSIATATARTRFNVDLVRRTVATAPGTTLWMENVATPATVIPGPTSGRFNSPTISASFGPDGTQHNIGFADSPLAYIDFKLAASTPPSTFIDLVADGSTTGLPRLGAAALNVPPEDAISLETPLSGATKGYLDIVTNGQLGAPAAPIFLAIDLTGDTLPPNLTITDGSNVTADLLTTAQAIWGTEYDLVFRFNASQPDIAFDFFDVGVDTLVVFTEASIPEPASLAVLAMPACLLLRRRTR